MIISHRYRFIFFKPRRVAGTSLEVALAKKIGPKDILTPVTRYSPHHDRDHYKHHPQNYRGYFNHIKPLQIKKLLGNSLYHRYFKFTVVRNPWDQMVSAYFWELNKKLLPSDFLRIIKTRPEGHSPFRLIFQSFCSKINQANHLKNFDNFLYRHYLKYANTDYYFDQQDQPLMDAYLKFENLVPDFIKTCRHLSFTPPKLPVLKSKTRQKKTPFQSFYHQKNRNFVAKIFKREISYFGYRFNDSPLISQRESEK